VTCFTEEPAEAPILIEGLPGIGQVGKLVAEYMIEEIGAELVAEIHSVHFPPQVLVDEQGIARLMNNEVYLFHGETNLLFLVGDVQSATSEGHYRLAAAYLDIAERFGVRRIYTLGGYGVGHFVDEPRVFAAVNAEELKSEVLEAGGTFPGEGGMGIVGTSGLLLGMGGSRGMEGICLMGETSGYLVDPISAKKLLSVLCRLLDIEVDPTRLSDRAKEMEQFIAGLKEESERDERRKSGEDLVYIG
jgi:uncharacterized protein (TIGR00162 family)